MAQKTMLIEILEGPAFVSNNSEQQINRIMLPKDS